MENRQGDHSKQHKRKRKHPAGGSEKTTITKNPTSFGLTTQMKNRTLKNNEGGGRNLTDPPDGRLEGGEQP